MTQVTEWDSIVDGDRYRTLTTIPQLHCFARPVDQCRPLPPTWHWLHTHETPLDVPLRRDGHPAQQPEGVPSAFTQRLWAGSEISIDRSVFAGTRVRFRLSVGRATIKTGRSGALAFVPTQISVFDQAGRVLNERRTVVYRQPVDGSAGRPTKPPPPELTFRGREIASTSVHLDEIALFRYSSLLGVFHRIHYDHPYATAVERYPNLVIHGPLLAQILVLYAQSLQGDCDAGVIKVHAHRPCFLGEQIDLRAVMSEESHRLVC